MNQIKGNEEVNKEDLFPKNFLQLLLQSKFQNVTEGLIVLLHSYLLEIGFIPEEVKDDVYSCMPNGWKSNGIFKIQYFHRNVPDTLFWVTWVPLIGNLVIQGTIDSKKSENTVHTALQPEKYINSQDSTSDLLDIFCQNRDLSRLFKDDFCYPLLAILEESANRKPSFGFSGLIDDLKFLIMKELPVEGIVALSSVNKDFHKKVNSKCLWRYLFYRDFGSIGPVADSGIEIAWKGMYITEHLKRNRRRFRPPPVKFHPYWVKFKNMDPAIQENSPKKQRRFAPSCNGLFHAGRHRKLPFVGQIRKFQQVIISSFKTM